MPVSAAISSRVLDFKDFSRINNSIFQDKYPKKIGIPYTPRVLPDISDCMGNDLPDISEDEAIGIALANGVVEDPCCPGISVHRDRMKIQGKWTTVWRVSGPCGKVLIIDGKSGEIVGTDIIPCYCACIHQI